MSASSMANVAISRAAGSRPQPGKRGGPGAVSRSAEEVGMAADVPDNPFTAAMKAVTTYIPTDVLALYVAGTAIFISVDGAITPDYDKAWAIFVGGLIATPLVNVLVFMAKLRSAGVALPSSAWGWPVWESVAATIAFIFWAAALPASPFSDFSWYDVAFAGFLLGVVSLFLGLVSSIIMPGSTAPANDAASPPPAEPAPEG